MAIDASIPSLDGCVANHTCVRCELANEAGGFTLTSIHSRSWPYGTTHCSCLALHRDCHTQSICHWLRQALQPSLTLRRGSSAVTLLKPTYCQHFYKRSKCTARADCGSCQQWCFNYHWCGKVSPLCIRGPLYAATLYSPSGWSTIQVWHRTARCSDRHQAQSGADFSINPSLRGLSTNTWKRLCCRHPQHPIRFQACSLGTQRRSANNDKHDLTHKNSTRLPLCGY